MKMNRKSKYLGRVAHGKVEQATGEAPGDDQLAAAGSDDQTKDNLEQAAQKGRGCV